MHEPKDRVREHTPSPVNAKIDRRTRTELEAHAASPAGIETRLDASIANGTSTAR